MKSIHTLLVLLCFALIGCNNMYIKPQTMDKTQVVYADRGGYTMRHSIKEQLEKRDYKVTVGKTKNSATIDNADIEIDSYNTMNARYIVKVSERREIFNPIWCAFNGMWWWNFNVSISDQKTGEELLSWRGRGCANSSLRKLDNALDKLEIK